MKCPTDKGFERRDVGRGIKCVYKPDPKYAITLKTLSAILFTGSTLEDVKAADPKAYGEFVTEKDRLTNEVNVLYANIAKEQKVSDAFKTLQAAENARDTAPDAYQQARTMYYTLVKGEDWKEEEKARIVKTEVDPLVAKYKTNRTAALNQYNNQQRTVEVVTGLKDRVLSLKDEMKYSVNTFADQLKKVENAINMERRGREKVTTVSPWSWLDVILNVAIVAALIYAVFAIYPKIFKPAPPNQLMLGQAGRGRLR